MQLSQWVGRDVWVIRGEKKGYQATLKSLGRGVSWVAVKKRSNCNAVRFPGWCFDLYLISVQHWLAVGRGNSSSERSTRTRSNATWILRLCAPTTIDAALKNVGERAFTHNIRWADCLCSRLVGSQFMCP